MNNRQRQILANQIQPALDTHRGGISVTLTSALLEIEEAHLHRLEDQGLFPVRIRRADGSRGYDLEAVYHWLKNKRHGAQ